MLPTLIPQDPYLPAAGKMAARHIWPWDARAPPTLANNNSSAGRAILAFFTLAACAHHVAAVGFWYPPVALNTTSGSTTTSTIATTVSGAAYGNGVYLTSSSSAWSASYVSGFAFDHVTSTGKWGWASANGRYSSVAPMGAALTSLVANTSVSGTTYGGEWVQIQLPCSVALLYYGLWTIPPAAPEPTTTARLNPATSAAATTPSLPAFPHRIKSLRNPEEEIAQPQLDTSLERDSRTKTIKATSFVSMTEL